MKAIKDVFLFNMQDKASGLKAKMLGYRPELDDVQISDIEEQLMTISKRYNYPAKNIILHDLSTCIKPIFNKDRINIPTYLPAYLMNNPKPSDSGEDRVIAIVNLTNYATKGKNDNNLNIDAKQLFGLLQTGEVFLTCYRKWNSITMSQEISKLGSAIYSRMFAKILDKMYSINLNPIKADKVKFVASKFFLINMLEKNPNTESINNIAYSNCTSKTTRNTINQFDEEFGNSAYKDFSTLIQQLNIGIEGLHTLKIRTFVDTSLKMYGPSIILAYEYLPMFFHTVFSVVIGSRFNNEVVLEPVLGNDADRLYTEFSNFMR